MTMRASLTTEVGTFVGRLGETLFGDYPTFAAAAREDGHAYRRADFGYADDMIPEKLIPAVRRGWQPSRFREYERPRNLDIGSDVKLHFSSGVTLEGQVWSLAPDGGVWVVTHVEAGGFSRTQSWWVHRKAGVFERPEQRRYQQPAGSWSWT